MINSNSRSFPAVVLGLMLSSGCGRAPTPQVKNTKMISRQQVQEMFDSMRAKAKWRIDDACCWGYFFTDYDRSKLTKAATTLEGKG